MKKFYLWITIILASCSYNGYQENDNLIKDYTLHRMAGFYRDADKKSTEAYSEPYAFEYEGRRIESEIPHSARFYSEDGQFYARIISIIGPRGRVLNQHLVLFSSYGYPLAMFSMLGNTNKMDITRFDQTGISITIVNWSTRYNAGLDSDLSMINYFLKKKHFLGDRRVHFVIDYETDAPRLGG